MMDGILVVIWFGGFWAFILHLRVSWNDFDWRISGTMTEPAFSSPGLMLSMVVNSLVFGDMIDR